MNENKDITLPYELALSELSLKEIGAIFKSFAFVKMTIDECENSMSADKSFDYHSIIENLINREIISIEYDDDDNQTMHINLEKKKELFWEVYQYDDNNNPMYYHYASYGDGHGPWKYMIRPVLVDMKVEWQDCSDLRLTHFDSFKSLVEAEKYYKGKIDETLKHNDIAKKDIKNDFWIYDESCSLHENNVTYRHIHIDIHNIHYGCDFYIRSMKTMDGVVWKLSSTLNPIDGVEIFESEDDAQSYCESLLGKKSL